MFFGCFLASLGKLAVRLGYYEVFIISIVDLIYLFFGRGVTRAAKLPLKRRNSWSSVELCLVIDDLDVQARECCVVLSICKTQTMQTKKTLLKCMYI